MQRRTLYGETRQHALSASGLEKISFLDATANWLLGDQGAGRSTVEDYKNYVQSVATYVRAENPKIRPTAHLSFGSMNPKLTVEAAQQLSGLVDGFLLAYPLSPRTNTRIPPRRIWRSS